MLGEGDKDGAELGGNDGDCVGRGDVVGIVDVEGSDEEHPLPNGIEVSE